MRRKAIWMISSVFVLYLVAGYVTWRWVPEKNADFFVRWVMTLGIFGAVLAALFGDYLRERIFPIDLQIEIPPKGNAVFDLTNVGGQAVNVYMHHLRVRNLTPHRPLKDCRVWLKSISVKSVSGDWEPKNQSPVPRLMEWAPSEFSRDKRTFSTWQIFDFGLSLANNGGFLVKWDRDQGGNVPRQFPVGTQLRFTFFLTADNYQDQKEFSFDVDVLHSIAGQTVTPAKVEPAK